MLGFRVCRWVEKRTKDSMGGVQRVGGAGYHQLLKARARLVGG